jgi:hypothetical protein
MRKQLIVSRETFFRLSFFTWPRPSQQPLLHSFAQVAAGGIKPWLPAAEFGAVQLPFKMHQFLLIFSTSSSCSDRVEFA